MTNEQKLRELVNRISAFTIREELMERITALISEHYVDKDIHDRIEQALWALVKRADELTTELEELKLKYDKALQQRDELREALAEQKRLYFNLFDEEISCMYCEAKIRRGSAIILCKECAENTEI